MSGCVHKQRERNLGHRLVALRTLHRRPVSHVRSRSLSLSRARALCKRLPLSHTHAHSCTHTHTHEQARARTHTRRPHRTGHTGPSASLARSLSVCLPSFSQPMHVHVLVHIPNHPLSLPLSLPPSHTTHPPPTPFLPLTQLTLHQQADHPQRILGTQ